MRVWIAAALFTLGLLDLELGGLAARWESRSLRTSVTQEQALMESPGGGFPPK